MKIIDVIRRYLHHTAQSAKMSEKISQQLNDLILNVKILNQNLVNPENNANLAFNVNNGFQAPPTAQELSNLALRETPLLFAHKTYNTSHPDYDVNIVRNFPGVIFNNNLPSNNSVYAELKKMSKKNEIPESTWNHILKMMLEEVKTVPHSEQVFERKEFVEKYLADLRTKYQAHYNPGWVNLEDALFLYWTVRHLKPKRIVQAGVCNGLSSAFMMLALAKNGPDGTLHVIDMPPIFDSSKDDWKAKGKVYGVVIPEGKSSGWLVPDAYADRFEVLNGDAKDLLPGLLKKVGNIDMFYHDSDHTYDHMIFEFDEAKKYLNKNGVIVADDISWNASLWDFADQYQVPAYNYRGSMGIACF